MAYEPSGNWLDSRCTSLINSAHETIFDGDVFDRDVFDRDVLDGGATWASVCVKTQKASDRGRKSKGI